MQSRRLFYRLFNALKKGCAFLGLPISFLGFVCIFSAGLLISHTDMMASIDHRIDDLQLSFSRHFFPNTLAIDPVIVGLDDKFLDSIDEPLSLSHFHIARLLQTLSGAGAKVIGVDIALPEKRFDTIISSRDPENDFHKTLLVGILQSIQQSSIVAAKVFDHERGRYREMQVDYAAVLNTQSEQQDAIASAHLCPSSDGKIRDYPGSSCQPNADNRSFSSEISAAAGKRENWSGMINYRLGKEFEYISMHEVLLLAKEEKFAQLKKMFGGKIVLIGSAQEHVDLLNLPVPLAKWLPASTFVPGVLVHAQLLRGMLNQGLIQRLPSYFIWILCAMVSCLWFGKFNTRKIIIAVFAMMALILLAGFLLQKDTYLPIAAIMATALLAFTGSAALQSWRHYLDKQRLSKAFTGRVSPSVMLEIIRGDADGGQISRRLPVCVLFSDVRNFTTMCEHMPAEEVVSLLNRYFSRMVRVIHSHGGTVDKFIGDGLMAFFGAPNTLISSENSAFQAAQEMLLALAEFNIELVQEGRAPWAIGVGLHAGEAVIGHLGSSERHEYTAIGDVVNTAARLESICKELGTPIVCSNEVAKAVNYPAQLVSYGEYPLKGRSPMLVFGYKLAQ